MIHRTNTHAPGFAPKASPDSADYREKVAVPVMAAVDAMPAEYRALVNDYGYIEVYRAWRRRTPPDEIIRRATAGAFAL